jgi:hypothetical protein
LVDEFTKKLESDPELWGVDMRIEEINLVGACELALTYPKQIQMILNKPVVIRCGRWCYTHKTLGNFYWARFAD